MSIGEIIAGGVIGGAKGYFDSNIKAAENARLAKEQSRQEELLNKRAEQQAKYAYKIQELKGKQESEKAAADRLHELEVENLKGKNSLAVANVKASGKGEKTSGYSEKELTNMQIKMEKEYGEKKAEAEAMGEKFMSYDDYVKSTYPKHAHLFGVTASTDPENSNSASSFVSTVLSRIKGKGGSEYGEPTEMVSHKSSSKTNPGEAEGTTVIPNKTEKQSTSSSGEARAATAPVVWPLPLGESGEQSVSSSKTDTPKEAAKLTKAVKKVASSNKVPEQTKALVKQAAEQPNTKLREFVFKAAEYAGKFTKKQWDKFASSLEAALEESRSEYLPPKK